MSSCAASDVELCPIAKLIDTAAIRLYAEIANDFNPIHLDAEFARHTRVGGIIAHGLLSVNLIWQSLAATLGAEAVARATLDVRFLRPVRVNDVVTVGGRRRAGQRGFEVWVRNQHGETVIAGHAHCEDAEGVLSLHRDQP